MVARGTAVQEFKENDELEITQCKILRAIHGENSNNPLHLPFLQAVKDSPFA